MIANKIIIFIAFGIIFGATPKAQPCIERVTISRCIPTIDPFSGRLPAFSQWNRAKYSVSTLDPARSEQYRQYTDANDVRLILEMLRSWACRSMHAKGFIQEDDDEHPVSSYFELYYRKTKKPALLTIEAIYNAYRKKHLKHLKLFAVHRIGTNHGPYCLPQLDNNVDLQIHLGTLSANLVPIKRRISALPSYIDLCLLLHSICTEVLQEHDPFQVSLVYGTHSINAVALDSAYSAICFLYRLSETTLTTETGGLFVGNLREITTKEISRLFREHANPIYAEMQKHIFAQAILKSDPIKMDFNLVLVPPVLTMVLIDPNGNAYTESIEVKYKKLEPHLHEIRHMLMRAIQQCPNPNQVSSVIYMGEEATIREILDYPGQDNKTWGPLALMHNSIRRRGKLEVLVEIEYFDASDLDALYL